MTFDEWVKTLPQSHWARYDLAACELGWNAAMAARVAVIDIIQEVKVQRDNLICRIHRDGGHYIDKHGIDKALNDADTKVASLFATCLAAREFIRLSPGDPDITWEQWKAYQEWEKLDEKISDNDGG